MLSRCNVIFEHALLQASQNSLPLRRQKLSPGSCMIHRQRHTFLYVRYLFRYIFIFSVSIKAPERRLKLSVRHCQLLNYLNSQELSMRRAQLYIGQLTTKTKKHHTDHGQPVPPGAHIEGLERGHVVKRRMLKTKLRYLFIS